MQTFVKDVRIESAADRRRALFAHLYREDRVDEARHLALESLGAAQTADERLNWSNSVAMLDRKEGNPAQALTVHLLAAQLSREATNHLFIANYHNGLALTYKQLGERESSPDRYDQALIEYEAARFHYEEAGNDRFLGGVENNIGSLLVSIGRAAEAHPHLDNARALFVMLGEAERVAEVDDTRAKAFLAEGRSKEAVAAACRAVSVLAETDELLTYRQAFETLARAVSQADHDDEAERIRAALKATGGNMAQAAERLGLNSKQALDYKIRHQFQELESVVPRRAKK